MFQHKRNQNSDVPQIMSLGISCEFVLEEEGRENAKTGEKSEKPKAVEQIPKAVTGSPRPPGNGFRR
jgi:hypothetical protein